MLVLTRPAVTSPTRAVHRLAGAPLTSKVSPHISFFFYKMSSFSSPNPWGLLTAVCSQILGGKKTVFMQIYKPKPFHCNTKHQVIFDILSPPFSLQQINCTLFQTKLSVMYKTFLSKVHKHIRISSSGEAQADMTVNVLPWVISPRSPALFPGIARSATDESHLQLHFSCILLKTVSRTSHQDIFPFFFSPSCLRQFVGVWEYSEFIPGKRRLLRGQVTLKSIVLPGPPQNVLTPSSCENTSIFASVLVIFWRLVSEIMSH